jgi:hypothetical protein
VGVSPEHVFYRAPGIAFIDRSMQNYRSQKANAASENQRGAAIACVCSNNPGLINDCYIAFQNNAFAAQEFDLGVPDENRRIHGLAAEASVPA